MIFMIFFAFLYMYILMIGYNMVESGTAEKDDFKTLFG